MLGDATTGQGLDAALDGVDVAYYLIHSMEGPRGGLRRRRAAPAEAFAEAARRAGVRRIVYLGGLVPADAHASAATSGSRLAVEETLLAAVPASIALRASIVVAAGSRSFRFLVRLIERLPVLGAAGLARPPHAAGRRARRDRVPGARPRRAAASTSGGRGTSAARTC